MIRLLRRVSLWNLGRGVRLGFLAGFSFGASSSIFIGTLDVSGSSSEEDVDAVVRSTISGFDSSAAMDSSADDDSDSESEMVA